MSLTSPQLGKPEHQFLGTLQRDIEDLAQQLAVTPHQIWAQNSARIAKSLGDFLARAEAPPNNVIPLRSRPYLLLTNEDLDAFIPKKVEDIGKLFSSDALIGFPTINANEPPGAA